MGEDERNKREGKEENKILKIDPNPAIISL